MMFNWTPDMIRFMEDASDYGTYFREVCSELYPYISKESTVCDAGCGLGHSSLELAERAGKVVACDINKDALSVLKKNCEKFHIENVDIVCGDIADLKTDKPFDAMLFCMYGECSNNLKVAKRLCNGKILMVMRNQQDHSFSPGNGKHAKPNFTDAAVYCKKNGIPFVSKEKDIEFGQPLRSLEDAFLFFKTYLRNGDEALLTEEYVRSRLVKKNDREFPWYIPEKRQLGFILVDTKDIPDDLI